MRLYGLCFILEAWGNISSLSCDVLPPKSWEIRVRRFLFVLGSQSAVWGQSEVILMEGKGNPVMLGSVQLDSYSVLANTCINLQL